MGREGDIYSVLDSIVQEEITSSYVMTSEDYFDPILYKSSIVSVEEFVESNKYLGLKGKIYKGIIETLYEVESASIREAFLEIGKGSGKSTLCVLSLLRGMYIFNELKDPYSLFKLLPGEDIYFTNVSISKDQAKDVIFTRAGTVIENSNYFNPITKSFARHFSIKQSRLKLLCGHSNDIAFLGYTTARAVMDESNFMMDSQKRAVAQKLFVALAGSLKTRFSDFYKIVSISSKNNPNSFQTSRIELLDDGVILTKENHKSSIGLLKDRYECSEDSIVDNFVLETGLDRVKSLRLINAKRRYSYKGSSFAMRAPSWSINENLTIENFIKSFTISDNKIEDVVSALRDFGNITSASAFSFFSDPDVLDKNAGKYFPLVVVKGNKFILKKDRQVNKLVRYYLASDLSVKGDKTGLAMVHKRFDNKIFLDFACRIEASFGNRVDYRDIRKLIFALMKLGYKFGAVGFDQYQSNDSIVILSEKGVKALEVSYSEHLVGNSNLHRLIHEKNFIYSKHNSVFIGEAKELQLKGKRVDHLTSDGHFNSKDVWDAVVDAVHLCEVEEGRMFEAEYE